MKRKRLILPLAVVTVGSIAAVAGVMNADAATTPKAAHHTVRPHRTTKSASPTTATPSPTVSKTTAAPVKTTTAAPTTAAASPSASVAEDCTSGDSITAGKYWISNNEWGASSGTGSQCIAKTAESGGTIGWSTSWTWSGVSNQVKSFASTVLGWHWGTKITGTGLPGLQLSAHKAVNTTWNFKLTQTTANTLDVSYDLWFHSISNPTYSDQPTDEVMVWLDREGGAGPVGTKQATVTIGGTTWDLYQGNIGWNVYSFVRETNTTSSSLNLTDFTDNLISRGLLQNAKYLSSVESGTEIFTGQGRLDTDAYSVTIG